MALNVPHYIQTGKSTHTQPLYGSPQGIYIHTLCMDPACCRRTYKSTISYTHSDRERKDCVSTIPPKAHSTEFSFGSAVLVWPKHSSCLLCLYRHLNNVVDIAVRFECCLASSMLKPYTPFVLIECRFTDSVCPHSSPYC